MPGNFDDTRDAGNTGNTGNTDDGDEMDEVGAPGVGMAVLAVAPARRPIVRADSGMGGAPAPVALRPAEPGRTLIRGGAIT